MDIIKIQKDLFELQDIGYRDFHAGLVPNIPKNTIIGVRTPALRGYAKKLYREKPELSECFMRSLPHDYYDENNLHAFLLAEIKDYDRVIKELNVFLPYVDNWATCDGLSPKVFGKHKEELLEEIRVWIASERTYTVRFAIGMLLKHYLDEAFREELLELVSAVESDEYYVNMMCAWYFATALAKQYDSVISYITEKRLSPWIHNKTIQKAVESYRISEARKAFLKSLKVKVKG